MDAHAPVALLPCPFCGDKMMLREALWPSEGDTDGIIHASHGTCPLPEFSVGIADQCASVIAAWNRRALSAVGGETGETDGAPEWIRVDREGVGQNGGFWTCAAATETSPKYIRSDIVARDNATLRAEVARLEGLLAAVRDDAMRTDNELCAMEARAEATEAELARLKAQPGVVKAAQDAVAELANVPMQLSLEDWSRISNAILAALAAPVSQEPVAWRHEQVRRALKGDTNA